MKTNPFEKLDGRRLIIAIDPGTYGSALVVWDGDNQEIIEHGKVKNEEIKSHLTALLPKCDGPVGVFCEMIASYGMPVGQEVFETCLFIGQLQELVPGIHPGCSFNLIYRKDVKMHICGSARAKDSNIRQALIDRFGKPGTKKIPGLTYGLSGDTWAAFAVAVYSYDKIIEKDKIWYNAFIKRQGESN